MDLNRDVLFSSMVIAESGDMVKSFNMWRSLAVTAAMAFAMSDEPSWQDVNGVLRPLLLSRSVNIINHVGIMICP